MRTAPSSLVWLQVALGGVWANGNGGGHPQGQVSEVVKEYDQHVMQATTAFRKGLENSRDTNTVDTAQFEAYPASVFHVYIVHLSYCRSVGKSHEGCRELVSTMKAYEAELIKRTTDGTFDSSDPSSSVNDISTEDLVSKMNEQSQSFFSKTQSGSSPSAENQAELRSALAVMKQGHEMWVPGECISYYYQPQCGKLMESMGMLLQAMGNVATADGQGLLGAWIGLAYALPKLQRELDGLNRDPVIEDLWNAASPQLQEVEKVCNGDDTEHPLCQDMRALVQPYAGVVSSLQAKQTQPLHGNPPSSKDAVPDSGAGNESRPRSLMRPNLCVMRAT